MGYPSYLIHYNKNHSKKNGQFVSGDGDGDGTADEHHRYSKNGVSIKTEKRSGITKYSKQRYETTTTTIKKTGSDTDTVDNLVKIKDEKWFRKTYGIPDNIDIYKEFKPSEIGDFNKAHDKLDSVCMEASSIYEKTKDIKKATDYLVKNLGDISYEVTITNEKYLDEGHHYVSYALTAYGKDYEYGSVGDTDMSDEEYFWYNEKKK